MGFLDEAETLSWEIASGKKHAIQQIHHVANEMQSVHKFLNRNDRLSTVMLNKVMPVLNELVDATKFWNRPSFLGKKKHLEHVKQLAEKLEKAIDLARHMLNPASFNGLRKSNKE